MTEDRGVLIMLRGVTFSIVLLLLLPCIATAEPGEDLAAQILEQSGVEGGLIVHLHCGEGQLTAALGARDCYTVQGLETDAERVEKARRHVREVGRYGRVSVRSWDGGGQLPYADNLVNLLVVSGTSSVDRAEIQRVLVPGGVAIFLTNDQGPVTHDKLVKPWPDEFDQWPHYLRGPDNNAVAQDSAVGPPQRMQWVDGPAYARSHEINSSMAAMVSAGGRLFTIWDEGPLGLADPRFPAKWALIARDGFNGKVLWKRPLPDWGWRQWHAASRWDDPRERAQMLRHLPATLPRRLVATADRLYVTLGYDAPVSVLDAATGEELHTFTHTELADELLLIDDMLVLRVRTPEHRPDRNVWSNMAVRQSGRVMAVDAGDGQVRWQSEPETMAPLTLAARGQRVYYSNYDQVVCLDRSSGRELWRTEQAAGGDGHRGTGGTLVARDDVVLYAQVPSSGGGHFGQLRAYSAETGQVLWTGPRYAGPGITNPPDLFVIDDLVWIGETRLPVDNMETEMRREGYDPLTGEVVREVSVPKLTSPGHHYRCYRSKATQRYLLLPKRGIEFLDVAGDDHMRHDWLRAPCIYGVLPCNGMLYVAPHQCVCYQGVLMSNFNALIAGTEVTAGGVGASNGGPRLRQGPAFVNEQSKIILRPSKIPTIGPCIAATRSAAAAPAAWYRSISRRVGKRPSPLLSRRQWCPMGDCWWRRRTATRSIRSTRKRAARCGRIRRGAESIRRPRFTALWCCSVRRTVACTVCGLRTAWRFGGSTLRRRNGRSLPLGNSNRLGPCMAAWSSRTT
jgi:outer membrane protein assembly factor BamB